MPIVSSTITSNNVEADGRRRIDELHIDDQGAQIQFTYLAAGNVDVAAILAARAASLPALARDREIAKNIFDIKQLGSLATPTFVYSTVAQNVAALRVAYKNATQLDAIFIGDFLSSCTDAQLMAAFGLTLPQVTTQRTVRLTPAANAAATIRAAVGA
jgi:hypothetical protein